MGRVWNQMVKFQIPFPPFSSCVILGNFLTTLETMGDMKVKQKLMLLLCELETQEEIGKMEHNEEFCWHWFALYNTISCHHNSTCVLVAKYLQNGQEPLL